MSLRRRLLALIALLLVASLLGGGLLTYWHGIRKIDLEMSSAISVGENALRDAVLPLLPGPITTSQIERIVSSFDGDRHLRAVLISDDGSTALESRVRPPADPAPRWLSRLLTGPPRTTELHLPEGRGKIMLRAEPLNEVTEVWEDAKLKLAIVGGFCTLVLAMISITLGRALRPLEDLSQALQQVGGGDYDAHVAESGPAELAEIYKGFNTMAGKLSDAERMNRRLNAQLNSIQDEERAEVARDLHDEVGPFLFAVDVDAQAIPALLNKGATVDVSARAQAIRQSVAHMQSHLRSVLNRLRPGLMLDLGVAQAAEQLASFWRARYPAIQFDIDCADESFGAALDETAFRVLQEGASNAVRHGKPTRIAFATRKLDTGMLVVSVTDDGAGLKATERDGFGLSGMRERLARMGGTLSIHANPNGRGVILRAEMPYVQTPRPRPTQQEDTSAAP